MADSVTASAAAGPVSEDAAVATPPVAEVCRPLRAKMYYIHSWRLPDPSLLRSSHSLTIVGELAFLYGGNLVTGYFDVRVHAIRLPTNCLYMNVGHEPITLPMAAGNQPPDGSATSTFESYQPNARAAHAATAVGTTIYIFGGHFPIVNADGTKLHDERPLEEEGAVHAFCTRRLRWTTLVPAWRICRDSLVRYCTICQTYKLIGCSEWKDMDWRVMRNSRQIDAPSMNWYCPKHSLRPSATAPLPRALSKDEVTEDLSPFRDLDVSDHEHAWREEYDGASYPCGRTYASMTGTALPDPRFWGTDMLHGALFLHGGYDVSGKELRDVWCFDVASCTWSRWPDVPEHKVHADDVEGGSTSATDESAMGEGKVGCVGDRLYRVGDGLGKVSYLEMLPGGVSGINTGHYPVRPKTGNWITITSGRRPMSTRVSPPVRTVRKPVEDPWLDAQAHDTQLGLPDLSRRGRRAALLREAASAVAGTAAPPSGHVPSTKTVTTSSLRKTATTRAARSAMAEAPRQSTGHTSADTAVPGGSARDRERITVAIVKYEPVPSQPLYNEFWTETVENGHRVLHGGSECYGQSKAVDVQAHYTFPSAGTATEPTLTDTARVYPLPRWGGGFLPITTGNGRVDLLQFLGLEGPTKFISEAVWNFRLTSPRGTPPPHHPKPGCEKEPHKNACSSASSCMQTTTESPKIEEFVKDADLGGWEMVHWEGDNIWTLSRRKHRFAYDWWRAENGVACVLTLGGKKDYYTDYIGDGIVMAIE